MNEHNDYVPCLSEKIEFNKLSDNDYILCNEKNRHYIKINKNVYQILSLIDGKNNIENLSSLLNEKYDIIIPPDNLYYLLCEKLASYGVLKGFDDKIKKYSKPTYLKLSFTIINEKILNKIVRKFDFLFSKNIAFISILISTIIILIILVTQLNLYKTFNVQNCFINYIILMILSSTLHEIGHATAAYHYGAKHGGIGGGFYLFTPVYYADVTDIWRLKKSHRIIVSLAGIYFELIFSAVIISFGFIINNYNIIIIAFILFISTLFNLNPFIRSDGFWVVSDLINQPNLFQHSLKKIKEVLLWLFSHKEIKWELKDIVLIIYGLVSYTFIGMFLYYVLVKNPQSILYLPHNILKFIKGIIHGDNFSVSNLISLIIPLMFYLMAFNLIKDSLKNISLQKRNNKS